MHFMIRKIPVVVLVYNSKVPPQRTAAPQPVFVSPCAAPPPPSPSDSSGGTYSASRSVATTMSELCMQKKRGETSWKKKTLAHSFPGARSWRSIHAVKSHMKTQLKVGTDIATRSGSGQLRLKKSESMIWPTPKMEVKRVR